MKRILTLAAAALTMISLTFTSFASVQRDVLLSDNKAEKDRVFTSIKKAREVNSYFGDAWGVAWAAALNKDEIFDVFVYQVDDNQANPTYKFKFKAPWSYVYYQDIAAWYPSLKGKNVELVITKNGQYLMTAYGVVNSNTVDMVAAQERAGGNYIADDADFIKVEYGGNVYLIYSDGEIVKK